MFGNEGLLMYCFRKWEKRGSIGFDPATSLHLHGSYFNIVVRDWFILKYYGIYVLLFWFVLWPMILAWMPTKFDTTTFVYLRFKLV